MSGARDVVMGDIFTASRNGLRGEQPALQVVGTTASTTESIALQLYSLAGINLSSSAGINKLRLYKCGHAWLLVLFKFHSVSKQSAKYRVSENNQGRD